MPLSNERHFYLNSNQTKRIKVNDVIKKAQ